MLSINKITSNSTVDFAAEELKKYLRMMMPEAGDISISYAPSAKSGFRLGLMQDFGLCVSDAEDTDLDDILYIIGKDRRWLLEKKLLPYILKHREDFGDRLEENTWPLQDDL